MKARVLLSSAFLTAFVLVANAPSIAAPTPVPDMKPDLSAMNFFMGTWKCTAMIRGKSRPDTATTSLSMDGRWITTHDVAPPFDQFRTRPITSDTAMTYNPLNHMWVQIYHDDFGGYGMATSPGWKGATITWTSTLSNDGSTGHDTLTKVSDTESKTSP